MTSQAAAPSGISPTNAFPKMNMCSKMDINGNYIQSWTPRSANANFCQPGNFQNIKKIEQTMMREPLSRPSFEPRSVSDPPNIFLSTCVVYKTQMVYKNFDSKGRSFGTFEKIFTAYFSVKYVDYLKKKFYLVGTLQFRLFTARSQSRQSHENIPFIQSSAERLFPIYLLKSLGGRYRTRA